MTLDEARILFEHNDWANVKLVEMLSKVFGEETDLQSTDDPRISTLHKTTVHILAGMAFWRTRVFPDARTEKVVSGDCPSPLDIGFAFRAESARFWSLFDSFEKDDSLLELIRFNDFDNDSHALRLDRILTHLSTHSIYHRGQITGMLISMDRKEAVESTDILYYYKERFL